MKTFLQFYKEVGIQDAPVPDDRPIHDRSLEGFRTLLDSLRIMVFKVLS